MNILVTGGAGFIGGAVVRHVINNTDFNVINIDKLTYAGNLNSLKSIENSKRYHFYKIDICDEMAIKQIFNQYKPSVIMHLAAESHVDNSILDPDNFIRTNIYGTYNLLKESRAYFDSLSGSFKSKFRFLHISTDEVFGDLQDRHSYFKETTPYNPSSPYSASKASSDHLVKAWGRTYELPVIITNCSNNYGPYHFPEKLIPRVIINALNGISLPIYGDGKQVRDWLYVEDHVRALFDVVEKGRLGETYNIGGNNEKENIEVVTLICEILEELSPIKKSSKTNKYKDLIVHTHDRPGHDIRYAIDASKIKNDLNWTPKETFESGIIKTVKWYLDNKEWWRKILSKDTGEMK